MKPKRIKKYQNLEGELRKLFQNTYKDGFDGLVMDFTDPRDQNVFKAVPLETDEYYYLVNIESVLKASTLGDEEDELPVEEKGALIDAVLFGEDMDDEEEVSDEEIEAAE